MEELGGVEVHGRVTGQIGLAAEDAAEANALVRRFLSFLPSNAWTPPPRAASAEPEISDVAGRLPANRRRAYDMRGVVRGIVDAGTMLELMPFFGGAFSPSSLVSRDVRLESSPASRCNRPALSARTHATRPPA